MFAGIGLHIRGKCFENNKSPGYKLVITRTFPARLLWVEESLFRQTTNQQLNFHVLKSNPPHIKVIYTIEDVPNKRT
jgi:hypothetical protein